MTIEMVRAARELLSWNQTELARRAGIAISTLRRLEGSHAVAPETKARVEAALRGAGIVFLENGVRLCA